jgi:hypothetical protein
MAIDSKEQRANRASTGCKAGSAAVEAFSANSALNALLMDTTESRSRMRVRRASVVLQADARQARGR